MSSDVVNASPEDVRKLAIALAKYQTDVTMAAKRVQGALTAANWHDDRKRQFEQSYRDLQRSIDQFMSGEVQTMIRSLHAYAQRLTELKSMKMG